MISNELPRLLHGTPGTPLTLSQHEQLFAPSRSGLDLLSELEAAGLKGRGGAAFPTAVKARFVREQRGRKCVVVNAMEGEPASHKDQFLLSTNPHLVLDGAEILASIVGADRVVVCVPRDRAVTVNHVQRALHERERRGGRGPSFELRGPPWRYVAGEESALVHWLDDNESLPQYRAQRPHVLRVQHRATLVDNAETCAHVGLIGRFGASWFSSLGTRDHPGSLLVSLSGAVEHPTVLEAVLGTPITSLLATGRAHPRPQAVLVGGYGGSWISGEDLSMGFDNDALRPYGASVGAGVLLVLPPEGCGLVETTRVVRWMAKESARQCGPCAFGLPALAQDLGELSRGTLDATAALKRLSERADAIEGRGACRHPDGVVRLVRSALTVFADDARRHADSHPCEGARATRHYATVPRLERESELVWQ